LQPNIVVFSSFGNGDAEKYFYGCLDNYIYQFYYQLITIIIYGLNKKGGTYG
jgi:hypothetical protein